MAIPPLYNQGTLGSEIGQATREFWQGMNAQLENEKNRALEERRVKVEEQRQQAEQIGTFNTEFSKLEKWYADNAEAMSDVEREAFGKYLQQGRMALFGYFGSGGIDDSQLQDFYAAFSSGNYGNYVDGAPINYASVLNSVVKNTPKVKLRKTMEAAVGENVSKMLAEVFLSQSPTDDEREWADSLVKRINAGEDVDIGAEMAWMMGNREESPKKLYAAMMKNPSDGKMLMHVRDAIAILKADPRYADDPDIKKLEAHLATPLAQQRITAAEAGGIAELEKPAVEVEKIRAEIGDIKLRGKLAVEELEQRRTEFEASLSWDQEKFYKGLEQELQLAYLSMDSQEKMFFARLDKEDQWIYARLEAEEAMQYRELDQREREFVRGIEWDQAKVAMQLGHEEKLRLMELKQQNAQFFAGLDAENLRFFARMNVEDKWHLMDWEQRKELFEKELNSTERRFYDGLSAENQRFYAGLTSTERMAMDRLMSEEKIAGNQIASQEKIAFERMSLDEKLEYLRLENDDKNRQQQDRQFYAGLDSTEKMFWARLDHEDQLSMREIDHDTWKTMGSWTQEEKMEVLRLTTQERIADKQIQSNEKISDSTLANQRLIAFKQMNMENRHFVLGLNQDAKHFIMDLAFKDKELAQRHIEFVQGLDATRQNLYYQLSVEQQMHVAALANGLLISREGNSNAFNIAQGGWNNAVVLANIAGNYQYNVAALNNASAEKIAGNELAYRYIALNHADRQFYDKMDQEDKHLYLTFDHETQMQLREAAGQADPEKRVNGIVAALQVAKGSAQEVYDTESRALQNVIDKYAADAKIEFNRYDQTEWTEAAGQLDPNEIALIKPYFDRVAIARERLEEIGTLGEDLSKQFAADYFKDTGGDVDSKDYEPPKASGTPTAGGWNDQVKTAVLGWATELQVDPNDLAAVIGFETAGKFSPATPNGAGGSARGLIQFMPATVRSLLKLPAANKGGPSDAELIKRVERMSLEEQGKLVVQYLKQKGIGKGSKLADIYKAIIAPGRKPGEPLYVKGRDGANYTDNAKALDLNNDGTITIQEASKAIANAGHRKLYYTQDAVAAQQGGSTTSRVSPVTYNPSTGYQYKGADSRGQPKTLSLSSKVAYELANAVQAQRGKPQDKIIAWAQTYAESFAKSKGYDTALVYDLVGELLDNADLVPIATPNKETGEVTFLGKTLKPEVAKKIWETYKPAYSAALNPAFTPRPDKVNKVIEDVVKATGYTNEQARQLMNYLYVGGKLEYNTRIVKPEPATPVDPNKKK